MKVAVTGSSGLIGSALTASLRADGHTVVRLVRRSPRASDEIRWDPRAADAGDPALSGVDACVHLAGAGVGDQRWTARYKAEIRASRVLATQALAGALAAASPRPKALISASAIGWYGDTGGAQVAEGGPAGTGFLSRVVADWESAAAPAREAGIRVVHLRSGLVLGRGGGVLQRLALPARFSALPRFGDGSQVMSWISLTDEVRAIRFLLDGDGADGRAGPYNLTAPNPVTNAELTAALHAALNRPGFRWLRVPAPVLKLTLGEMSVELLTSTRVLPERLLDAGFRFEHPTVDAALAAELAPLSRYGDIGCGYWQTVAMQLATVLSALISAVGTLCGALGGIALTSGLDARRQRLAAISAAASEQATARDQARTELAAAITRLRADVELACARHWRDMNVRLTAIQEQATTAGVCASRAAMIAVNQAEAETALALGRSASALSAWTAKTVSLGDFDGPGRQFVAGQIVERPDFTELDALTAAFLGHASPRRD